VPNEVFNISQAYGADIESQHPISPNKHQESLVRFSLSNGGRIRHQASGFQHPKLTIPQLRYLLLTGSEVTINQNPASSLVGGLTQLFL